MAYVIDITANTSRAGRSISALERTLVRLDAVLNRVAKSMNAVASASSRAGGISSMGGPVRGSSQRPTGGALTHAQMYNFYRSQSLIGGGGYRAQMLASAGGAYNAARAQFLSGNFSAASGMAAWAGRISKLQGGGGQSAVAKWLASSRFGIGSGGVQMMPLIGQTVGMLAKLGPHGMAAAAALAALAGGALMAKRGFDTLLGISGTKFETGASFGEASRLQAIGSYLGGDINSRVNSFQDAISSGGYAASYASKAGINVVGGPFGDRNYGRKYLRYLDAVYGASSDATADRMSMAVGQRDMQRVRMLDPGTYARLKNSMNYASSPAAARAAERAKAELAMFNNELDRFASMMASSVLPVLTKLLAWINKLLDFALGNTGASTALGLALGGPVGAKVMRDASEAYQRDREAKSRQDQTMSLDANTRALKDFREVIGGGARASGSMPSKLRGDKLGSEAMRVALASGMI